MTFSRITGSAVSLNVAHPEASAAFARTHLGFSIEMSADGFVSLAREDAGFNLIYLRIGLETFKPARLAGQAMWVPRGVHHQHRNTGSSSLKLFWVYSPQAPLPGA